ncbi:MAG: hypothetical protein R3E31_04420 [Chloroflexota bacterium]
MSARYTFPGAMGDWATAQRRSAAADNSLVVRPDCLKRPLAEDYHYVLLLPSLGTAVWWAAKTGHGKLPLLICHTAVGPATAIQTSLLAQSWLALFAYPRVYGAYLLWGWLLWQLPTPDSATTANRHTSHRLHD